MSSVNISRRSLLRTGPVTSALILAGCADDSTGGPERESDSEDSEDRIANPETASIREDADAPLVRIASEDDDVDETDGSHDADEEPDDLLVLTDSADADALEYDRDRDGSDAVHEQLQATFVRVPVAYEATSSGWCVGGSSSCRTNIASDDGGENGTANAEDDE